MIEVEQTVDLLAMQVHHARQIGLADTCLPHLLIEKDFHRRLNRKADARLGCLALGRRGDFLSTRNARGNRLRESAYRIGKRVGFVVAKGDQLGKVRRCYKDGAYIGFQFDTIRS